MMRIRPSSFTSMPTLIALAIASGAAGMVNPTHAAPVAATWRGGTGVWSAASDWTCGSTACSAYPNNGVDNWKVTIPNRSSRGITFLTADTAVTVDSLSYEGGAAGGGQFTIQNTLRTGLFDFSAELATVLINGNGRLVVFGPDGDFRGGTPFSAVVVSGPSASMVVEGGANFSTEPAYGLRVQDGGQAQIRKTLQGSVLVDSGALFAGQMLVRTGSELSLMNGRLEVGLAPPDPTIEPSFLQTGGRTLVGPGGLLIGGAIDVRAGSFVMGGGTVKGDVLLSGDAQLRGGGTMTTVDLTRGTPMLSVSGGDRLDLNSIRHAAGRVTVDGSGSVLATTGDFRQLEADTEVTRGGRLLVGGTFADSGGRLLVAGAGSVLQAQLVQGLRNDSRWEVVNGGAIVAQTVDVGAPGSNRLHLNLGRVQADSIIVPTAAAITGDGTLQGDVLVDGGRLAPGGNAVLPVGRLVIDGDLSVRSGLLEIDIADPNFVDEIDVGGLADFAGGTIRFLMGEFDLPALTSLRFLNAGSIAGFDSIRFELIGADCTVYQLCWEVRRTGGMLDFVANRLLSSVPEPGGLALVTLALGILTARRQRKTRPSRFECSESVARACTAP